MSEKNMTEYPKCGHSACRQNWIDTAETRCIQETKSTCPECGSDNVDIEAWVGVNDNIVGEWCGDYYCNGCDTNLGSRVILIEVPVEQSR